MRFETIGLLPGAESWGGEAASEDCRERAEAAGIDERRFMEGLFTVELLMLTGGASQASITRLNPHLLPSALTHSNRLE
jgi:hypothetical protein